MILTEDILLAYFFEKVKPTYFRIFAFNFYEFIFNINKAKNWKVSSLWTTYSMIKSMVQLNENVDISDYKKLNAFLKRQKDNYEAKKSKVLSSQNVKEFLDNAPDEIYLLMKLVLIFCLNGACRKSELCSLKCEDIQESGSILVVTLNDTKTKKRRIFTITSECDGIEYYKKYCKLRPNNIEHGRFFIFYKNGKCTSQPVGINSFACIPKKISEFLKLPDPNLYTGHCLRRTSTTFLADSGADIQTIQRHGGWQSSKVAMGYVEDSISNKIKTSKKIFGETSSSNDSAPQCDDKHSGVTTSVQVPAHDNPTFEVPINCFDSNGISITRAPQSAESIQQVAGNPQQLPLDIRASSVTFSNLNLNNCVLNFYTDQKK